MMLGVGSSVHRRPGRPRDARVDDAVMAATLELVGEHGFSGVSVEAVAAQAGVSKTTIYRRWPSREQLLLAAAGCIADDIVHRDTGTLRGDLMVIAAELSEKMVSGQIGSMLPTLISEASRSDEVRCLLTDFTTERRRPALEAIERAKARGEIRADVDADDAIDVALGPIFARYLLFGTRVDDAAVTKLVDLALAGLQVDER